MQTKTAEKKGVQTDKKKGAQIYKTKGAHRAQDEVETTKAS